MKITTKHIRNSPLTFVTQKRFAVLFFLPSCFVNSLLSQESDLKGLEDLSLKTTNQESQYFDKTSRPPYWCPKLMRPRPYWCPKPILREMSLFLCKNFLLFPNICVAAGQVSEKAIQVVLSHTYSFVSLRKWLNELLEKDIKYNQKGITEKCSGKNSNPSGDRTHDLPDTGSRLLPLGYGRLTWRAGRRFWGHELLIVELTLKHLLLI